MGESEYGVGSLAMRVCQGMPTVDVLVAKAPRRVKRLDGRVGGSTPVSCIQVNDVITQEDDP
jgi:hypothetical protein